MATSVPRSFCNLSWPFSSEARISSSETLTGCFTGAPMNVIWVARKICTPAGAVV